MHPTDADDWKNQVLEEVLSAVAANPELRAILIFKGARILAKLLPDAHRQSLDLDANCTEEFLATFPERDAQADYLREHLEIALTRRFELREVVELELRSITVTPKPKREHRFGWNAFEVKVKITDHRRSSDRGIPSIRIDLAYPESLSDLSISEIEIDGNRISAYSLERIAAEKLRAFLSSLPAHQAKTGRAASSVRVKDLYDLAQIIAYAPLTDQAFWRHVSQEFLLACESRGVDCPRTEELDSCKQDVARLYDKESIIPRDISFDAVWDCIVALIRKYETDGITPFTFSMPATVHP